MGKSVCGEEIKKERKKKTFLRRVLMAITSHEKLFRDTWWRRHVAEKGWLSIPLFGFRRWFGEEYHILSQRDDLDMKRSDICVNAIPSHLALMMAPHELPWKCWVDSDTTPPIRLLKDFPYISRSRILLRGTLSTSPPSPVPHL